MAHDNNVSVGSIGSGNTVNIVQHQTPEAPHIEYVIEKCSVQHLSATEVKKGFWTFWVCVLLPVLAFVADSLGILSFLGIQTLWALAVVIPIALIGTALTNGKRKIAELPSKSNEARFVDGRLVEQENDGGYVLYRKQAPCIYPKCSGSVFISPAPPREQGNHFLVGVCNKGNHRHTYTVDYNSIGYPHQFDWRPVEERKSQP